MRKKPFGGRILMIGFGSVGHCTMPLIIRHFDMPLDRIAVVDGADHGPDIAPYVAQGVRYIVDPIVPDNLDRILSAHVGAGDLVLNLSVEVSSHDLIEWCHRHGTLYLDTCIEPWAHYYDNASIPEHERTNYYLRWSAKQKARNRPAKSPSALMTHGANPGLISHFVKVALLEVAGRAGLETDVPTTREGWASLAQRTGTKVIHVAEHDTQIASRPKRPGEFVNTWSVPGFIGEGLQPAELGWGTHEKSMPAGAHRHDFGCDSAIYLTRPGAGTRVRSWTPTAQAQHAWMITHNESISIADYFTLVEDGKLVYRPTCHYAYHPCDDAVLSLHEMAGAAWRPQQAWHILSEDDIVDGIDELGVLLYGHAKNAYWYGSQLSIEDTRKLAPYQNATGLQVTSAVLAGIIWMLGNPDRGIVEADEMDFRRCLSVQRPYLGPVVGHYTDWTPLSGRNRLFPERVDSSDPWQFSNVLVN
jgi:homospermidine synthase